MSTHLQLKHMTCICSYACFSLTFRRRKEVEGLLRRISTTSRALEVDGGRVGHQVDQRMVMVRGCKSIQLLESDYCFEAVHLFFFMCGNLETTIVHYCVMWFKCLFYS